MRRAASVAIAIALAALGAACTSKSESRPSRQAIHLCKDAASLVDTDDLEILAQSCADATTGKCREILRRFDKLDPATRLQQIDAACPPGSLPEGVSFQPPADAGVAAPSGPARLLLHQAEAELVWHGLNLHLGKDCPTLGVAVDTAGLQGQLVLVVDRNVLYPETVAVLDCLRTHVTDVTLEEAP